MKVKIRGCSFDPDHSWAGVEGAIPINKLPGDIRDKLEKSGWVYLFVSEMPKWVKDNIIKLKYMPTYYTETNTSSEFEREYEIPNNHVIVYVHTQNFKLRSLELIKPEKLSK